jgi:hypothetical protein
VKKHKAITRQRLHDTMRAHFGDVQIVMPTRKRPKADPDFTGLTMEHLRARADRWLKAHALAVAKVERTAKMERPKGKRFGRIVHTRVAGNRKLSRVVSPHTGEVLGEQG